MAEIKLFNEWLETHEISTSAIALWHALMYIAWRSGWQPVFSVPVSAIITRTKMSRSTIYREREILRDYGLIDFDVGDGRQSSNYRIIGFEERLASRTETQDGTQPDFASHTGTQDETQTPKPEGDSGFVSHRETQDGTQLDFVSHTETQVGTLTEEMSHCGTQNAAKILSDSCLANEKNEKTPYISIYKDINRDKGGCGGKKKNDGAKSKSPGNDAKLPKKKKPEFDLSFIGDGVWEALVSSWLEYKRSRSESYKSELSVKKFHTMLRNLSRGDPATARRIIDKSIANNWAGIFELTESDSRPRGQPSRPAVGQRIGQIKQPEDEERRRKLLEKFGSGKNPDDGSAKNKT